MADRATGWPGDTAAERRRVRDEWLAECDAWGDRLDLEQLKAFRDAFAMPGKLGARIGMHQHGIETLNTLMGQLLCGCDLSLNVHYRLDLDGTFAIGITHAPDCWRRNAAARDDEAGR